MCVSFVKKENIIISIFEQEKPNNYAYIYDYDYDYTYNCTYDYDVLCYTMLLGWQHLAASAALRHEQAKPLPLRVAASAARGS